MSPFSKLLGDLRKSRGFRQNKFAELIGYEQSYISALELGTKGSPSSDFIAKLNEVLDLNAKEQEQVENALARSTRKFILPTNASASLYEFCYALNQTAIRMKPKQLEMMTTILRLIDEPVETAPSNRHENTNGYKRMGEQKM